MRFTFDGRELPAPVWPAGISRVPFDPAIHPKQACELMNNAYAQGGGMVRPCREWWEELRNDPEFDPGLCIVVTDRKSARLVAFAQCWTSGFIKDIAVASGYRRRGIGRALMQEIFRVFRNQGTDFVDLKVQADNPSGAVAFYKVMEMRVVEYGD